MSIRARPNLLITTSTLPRWESDSEAHFVLDLARHLRPWFDPTIVAPAAPGAALAGVLDGVRVVRYRYAPLRGAEVLCYPGAIMSRMRTNPAVAGLIPLLFAGLWRTVRAELRRRRYACVHAHWFAPQGLLHALSFRARSHPPLVVTSHGGDMALLRYPFVAGAYRRVLRRASAVTVVAPQIARAIQQLMPSYPAEQLSVIPMGVDLDRFSSASRDSRWVRDRGLSAPAILFVGRLVEKKGVQVLLEALAMPPLAATGASVAIAGDGPDRGRLEGQARALGVQERVRFLGALPPDEIAAALASCDLYCGPSIAARDGDQDGLPTVLCEAAACGLPLVGSDLAGIPLIVEDGVTGLLVPSGNPSALSRALARLASDPDLRSTCGRAARDRAAQFSWHRVAERYARVLMAAARLGEPVTGAHPQEAPE